MLRAVSTFLMITMSTVAFAQEDFKSADSELNRLHKEILARLSADKSIIPLLTAARRNWILLENLPMAIWPVEKKVRDVENEAAKLAMEVAI